MIRLAVEQEGDPRSCETAIRLPGLLMSESASHGGRTLFELLEFRGY
jgi:hypothetical protein